MGRNKVNHKQIKSTENPHRKNTLSYLVWHEMVNKKTILTPQSLLALAKSKGFKTNQHKLNICVSLIRRGLAHPSRKPIAILDGRSCVEDRKTRVKKAA